MRSSPALVPFALALAATLALSEAAAQPVGRRLADSTPPRDDSPPTHPVPGAAGDTFSIRMEPGAPGRAGAEWISTLAPSFVNVPKMSASFVAPEAGTNVVIAFSAEAYTTHSTGRLFVRALVDGDLAAPADVVFTEGDFLGARSIEFTHVVGPGVHTVEIQWRVDRGARAYLRAGSVKIRQGRPVDDARTLTFHTPESGPSDMTTVSAWTPVPDSDLDFFVPPDSRAIVSFSAETIVQGDAKNLWVRAVVDGAPATPGDVVFARRSTRQVHLALFTTGVLAPGWHSVRMEWQVSSGGVASLGDRTLAVSARPVTSGDRTHRLVVAASGKKVSTDTSVWAPVPSLSSLSYIPQNGEIAVTFSGEVAADAGAALALRLRVGSDVVAEESVAVGADGLEFETQSFAFDRKHVFSRSGEGGLYGITLEWSVAGGAAAMGDRAMEILIEPGSFPDMAEAPEIGDALDAYPEGRPVEAAIGERPLLAVIHGVVRDAPNDVIPTTAELSTALFGPHGMDDYYLAMSGGRFTFSNAGVLAYDAKKSEDHYWSHDAFDCGGAAPDGFTGGHQERWAEALLAAEDDFPFDAYDRDGNGVLDSTELTIIVVAPQGAAFGTRRTLDPYCSGDPFVVDGVEIPEICEWFTSRPENDMSTAAHEIAHLALGLGDMYAKDVFLDMEPDSFSLMGDYDGTTTHLDAMQKLALGWLTPIEILSSGLVHLEDVKQGGTAIVLPRRGDGDGREFFLLENRRSAPPGDPLFDENHLGDGIVLWHVVESPIEHAAPPLCMDDTDWAGVTGNLRRAVRLVRPGITAASTGLSTWTDARYDLGDSGEICSDTEPDYEDRRHALRWADGTPSGYAISAWSAPGDVMSFFVTVP